MATTQTKAKAGTVEGSKETATQDSAPVPANVDEKSVPEVQGEADEADQPKAKGPKRWVEYQNAQHFEIRTITPQDWAKAGVEEGKLLHWHKGNSFRVPLEELQAFLSEGQIQQYILSEARFAIVED
jgi:hypothetical protein